MNRTWIALLSIVAACTEAHTVGDGDTTSRPDATPEVEVTLEVCGGADLGRSRCAGALVEQCTDGAWTPRACDVGTACDDGQCAPITCTPFAAICQDARTLAVCNAAGTRLVREACVFGGCEDDRCAERCVPGTRRCDGQNVLACDELGVEALTQTCDLARGEVCGAGRCLSECEVQGGKRSYMACDFWAADLPNDASAIDNVFAFAFSNGTTRPATITITYPWERVETLEVPAGTVGTHRLPVPRLLSQIPVAGVGRYGFHIQSDQPIAAWMFNPLERYDEDATASVATNDASLLIPTTSLGTDYVAVTWSDLGQYSKPPFVTVVATQDDTRVVVRTTADVTMAQAPYRAPAGQEVSVTLQAHETLNLEPSSVPGVRRDLTGTSVKSDRAVAVFSGNRCARVPDAGRFCDHIETQLPSVDTWGERFVVTKFTDRGGESDYFRVVATTGGTRLTFDPPRDAPILVAGGIWEFESKADFVVTSTHPVLLAQFMASQNMTRPPGPFGVSSDCPSEIGGTCQGDPALVLAAPIEQWRRDLTFLVPDTYRYQFINIAFAAGTEILLDGIAIDTSAAQAIGADAWRSLVVPVLGGFHTLFAGQPIGVVVYGYDHNISYAYNAGLDFRSLSGR